MTALTRALLAAVAVVAAAAVPANASTDLYYSGECSYDAVAAPTAVVGEPETFEGVMYAYAVLGSDSDPAREVSATLTCTISYGDGSVVAATFSGTRLLYGAEPIEFTTAQADSGWRLCETVDYHDDGEPPSTICHAFTMEQVPPQEIHDFVDDVLASAPGSKDALCAAIRAAEPFVPDVWYRAMVSDEGDVQLTKYTWWHCP